MPVPQMLTYHCNCLTCPIAAPGAWNYTSPFTNLTYVFNSTLVAQSTAQGTCKASGGHLVAWFSLEEQADVEAAFVQGELHLPRKLPGLNLDRETRARHAFEGPAVHCSTEPEH
jgi:hypothetical protein